MNAPASFSLAVPIWVATPCHELLLQDRGAEYSDNVDKLYTACDAHFTKDEMTGYELRHMAYSQAQYLGRFARYLVPRVAFIARQAGLSFTRGDAAFKVVAYRLAERMAQKFEQEMAA
jgi:hypothetical protein